EQNSLQNSRAIFVLGFDDENFPRKVAEKNLLSDADRLRLNESGFEISKGYGSEKNDSLFVKDGKVEFASNKAGGINGGVSNGEPITMSVAFRPTPSIFKEQNTVDLQKMENTVIKIKGRHDSCIAVRGVPVVESAVAIAILDSIKE
ncbi:MAG: chorismate synthase, partial [Clostridia bacterium]|nr:chorismate synthase [Clostridia bacterium]